MLLKVADKCQLCPQHRISKYIQLNNVIFIKIIETKIFYSFLFGTGLMIVQKIHIIIPGWWVYQCVVWIYKLLLQSVTVAQWVEQLSWNCRVIGSLPASPLGKALSTKFLTKLCIVWMCVFVRPNGWMWLCRLNRFEWSVDNCYRT